MYNYFQLIGNVEDISKDNIMTLTVNGELRNSKSTKFYINVNNTYPSIKELDFDLKGKRIGIRGHLIFTNMLELVGDRIIVLTKLEEEVSDE